MRNPDRLRAVQQVLRESHRKLFALQTQSIASLQEALDAEALTIEATRDVFLAARVASIEATHAVAAARKTLEIVSEAHDAMAVLYQADNELEDLASNNDTP